jgi:hypothetical protein
VTYEHRCRLAALAGEKAANAGKARSSNNRPQGTMFYDAWCDGYDHVANSWDDEKRERLCA